MTLNRLQPRILIVEDEPILAMAIADWLSDGGFLIAGVTGMLEAALTMIESDVCDIAVLDANLKSVSAAPAASALASRRIPFVVLSGYSRSQLHEDFVSGVHLHKPCEPERLLQTLRGMLPA